MRKTTKIMAGGLATCLLGALACMANHDTDPGTRSAAAGARSSGPPIGPVTPAPGLTTWNVTSGGIARPYAVYLPERDGSARPWPVVVDIHGTGSGPEEELAVSGMADAAEARGFVVLMPIASIPNANGGAGWNVPPDAREVDDVRYVEDVLDDASRRLELDPRRVFVTGFSGGARLASEVASRLSHRIAALGAVGGLRAPAGSGGPVPVIAFHGARDPVNPFTGGGPAYWGYGVREALEGWAARNRCALVGDPVRSGERSYRLRGAQCALRGDLQLYVLDRAGHVWPGSAFPFPPERFGEKSDAVDATALMLDFFDRHPLARSPRRTEHRGARAGLRPPQAVAAVRAPRAP